MSPAEDVMDEAHPAAQSVVLVVEDEVLIRLATSDHLRECGFKVMEAATGAEAQELILAGLKVDLVLSDINMPGGVDGVALAHWLETHCPDVPVILVSGVGASLEAARKTCANVQVVATKPYDYPHIVHSMRTLLASRG